METEHILQIATKIMKDLGAGYSETIYQNAMHRKLARLDGTCVMEKIIPVVYDGDTLGVCRADIVLEGHVIEVKAVRKMPSGAEKQVGKYVRHLLDLDGKPRKGIVINFNQDTEEIESLESKLHEAPGNHEDQDTTPKRRKITPMGSDEP